MRPRYSAFVKGAVEYILETHHPDTRSEVNQEEIKSYLAIRLTDPKDAVVEFRAGPKMLYQRGTLLRGEQYGWGVCVWVNDKDKSGAFQGFSPMTFILRDEKIVHVNGGPDDGAIIGPQYARKQCEELGAPPVPGGPPA